MPEAKNSIRTFIALIRDRALSIQTAKTRFMSSEQAAKEFLGARPIIDEIAREYNAAQRVELESFVYESEYLSVSEIVRDDAELGIPPEVLWRAYDVHVRGRLDSTFNKSVFHFLLGQLAKIGDRYAADDLPSRLVEQPQETENILQYFKSVSVRPEEEALLFDFLELDDNVYAFQTAQFFQYFRARGTHDPLRLRAAARRFAFEASSPPYLRSEARAVRIYGNSTDFEAMLHAYAEASSHLERAEIVCCVGNMEASRRNSFFSTIAGANTVVDWAIEATRQNFLGSDPPAPPGYC